jgi:uncharacterized protein (DUF1810 family)
MAGRLPETKYFGPEAPAAGGVMTQVDLERFVSAQDNAQTFDRALAELRAGSKRTHWMWFVFPQIAGLGQSAVSRRFALSGLDEARAYLAHETLGQRLRESCDVVLGLEGVAADEVFGYLDAMKLRSSMTLFMRASPGEPRFQEILDRYFDGIPDQATDGLL